MLVVASQVRMTGSCGVAGFDPARWDVHGIDGLGPMRSWVVRAALDDIEIECVRGKVHIRDAAELADMLDSKSCSGDAR